MRKTIALALAAGLTVASIAATTTASSAAPLKNGDFSAGLANWNVLNQQVKLGTDVIGGCTSVDTTDYAAIRASAAPPLTGPNPHTDWSVPVFASPYTSVVQSSVVPTGSAEALHMASTMGTGAPYDVVHGPAAYSDRFSATPNNVITLNWRAQGGADHYATLAYLLDEETCTQYEILDSTGATTAWAEVKVAIPTVSSKFRFVFVSGTFDYSGGTGAGASLYIAGITSTGVNPNAATVSITAGPVTGKSPHQKVPLMGTTKKPKQTVKIYRARGHGKRAVFVTTATSSGGIWSTRKLALGRSRTVVFCAKVGSTFKSVEVKTGGKLVIRGDVIWRKKKKKRSVTCP
jgi:hypothetical protein